MHLNAQSCPERLAYIQIIALNLIVQRLPNGIVAKLKDASDDARISLPYRLFSLRKALLCPLQVQGSPASAVRGRSVDAGFRPQLLSLEGAST